MALKDTRGNLLGTDVPAARDAVGDSRLIGVALTPAPPAVFAPAPADAV